MERSGGAPDRVELFAVGTELVMGRIYDTNSFWIAEQLARLGTWPQRITCLPDDDDEVVRSLGEAMERGAKVIITTGGLGPTPDDRTLECIARLVGCDLAPHQPTIASFVQRRNVQSASELSTGTRKMAIAPVGANVYQNPAGWAPLIELTVDQTTFFIMPGPPREMQALWATHLEGILSQIFQTKIAAQRVRVTMFESEVSPLIQQVMAAFPQTYVKAYVALRDETTLPVDLVAHAPDENEATRVLHDAVALLSRLVIERGKEIELA